MRALTAGGCPRRRASVSSRCPPGPGAEAGSRRREEAEMESRSERHPAGRARGATSKCTLGAPAPALWKGGPELAAVGPPVRIGSGTAHL